MTADLTRALTAAREAVELAEKATPRQTFMGHTASCAAVDAIAVHAALHYPAVSRALIAQADLHAELMETYLAKVVECEDVQDRLCKALERCEAQMKRILELETMLNEAPEKAERACLRAPIGFYPNASDLRPAFAELVRAALTPEPSQ